MNLNVNGILNNKTFQQAAGGYMYLNAIGKSWGGDGKTVINDIVNGLMNNPHFPDLNSVTQELTKGTASAMIKQLVKLWLVGYGLKEIGIGAKYGNIAQKFAENAGKATIGATFLGFATAWNSPPAPYIEGSSVQTNFGNAPLRSAYSYC